MAARSAEQARMRRNPAIRGQHGVTLIESVITTALLGIIGATFMSALGGAFFAGSMKSDRVEAAALASRQVEYAKGLPFLAAPSTYATVPVSEPYSLSCAAEPLSDGNYQKLVVTVSKSGEALLRIEDYKVNR